LGLSKNFLYTRVNTGGDYIMSKKIFSEKDQMNLSMNKYVIRISDKAITYADEFKQLLGSPHMPIKLGNIFTPRMKKISYFLWVRTLFPVWGYFKILA
jgi:hypothetical protein